MNRSAVGFALLSFAGFYIAAVTIAMHYSPSFRLGFLVFFGMN